MISTVQRKREMRKTDFVNCLSVHAGVGSSVCLRRFTLHFKPSMFNFSVF